MRLLPVRTSEDLLKCSSIAVQVKNCGFDSVVKEIAASLQKLLIGLGIDMSDNKFKILLEDLVDVYQHDSIEDLQKCFRDARQGKYDWGHEKRGNINMVVIQYWMSQHLAKKADARERAYGKWKHGLSKSNELGIETSKPIDKEETKKGISQEKLLKKLKESGLKEDYLKQKSRIEAEIRKSSEGKKMRGYTLFRLNYRVNKETGKLEDLLAPKGPTEGVPKEKVLEILKKNGLYDPKTEKKVKPNKK
jgi:hypothetical protein